MRTVRPAQAPGRPAFRRRSAWLSILSTIGLLVGACAPAVPTPSLSSPTSPTSSQATSTSSAGLRPAPEDCEDFDFIPCPRQVARLSVPLAGSSFSLTYTSDRVPGRTITPSLPAAPIGLGGWSLDVLDGYDTSAGILVLGTGERRAAAASAVTVGGAAALAVPSADSLDVFVFDAQGRHLRTYDAITGALAYGFAWDAAGLASVTEPGGRVTRIRRDASGQPIEIVSARGYRTRLGTSGGWLAAVADPAGSITHIAASADGLVSALSDPTGASTTIAVRRLRPPCRARWPERRDGLVRADGRRRGLHRRRDHRRRSDMVRHRPFGRLQGRAHPCRFQRPDHDRRGGWDEADAHDTRRHHHQPRACRRSALGTLRAGADGPRRHDHGRTAPDRHGGANRGGGRGGGRADARPIGEYQDHDDRWRRLEARVRPGDPSDDAHRSRWPDSDDDLGRIGPADQPPGERVRGDDVPLRRARSDRHGHCRRGRLGPDLALRRGPRDRRSRRHRSTRAGDDDPGGRLRGGSRRSRPRPAKASARPGDRSASSAA